MNKLKRRTFFAILLVLSLLTFASLIFGWTVSLQEQSLISGTIGNLILRLPIVFGVGTMAVAVVAGKKLK